MNWTLKRTDTFLASFSNFRDNPVILKELEKKLRRLKEDPFHVGGWLHGTLHGKRATRIAHKYRLIFSVDEQSHTVYLILFDHREDVYRRK